MSRTIRRAGWHVTTSAKWHAQKNNPFAYIKKYNSPGFVEQEIESNLNEPQRLSKLMEERHRDSFWKTLRWRKYDMPIPRNMHKMAIKTSLRNDTDYNWDEKAARKYEKGLRRMLWD